jgi:hypothetical protein
MLSRRTLGQSLSELIIGIDEGRETDAGRVNPIPNQQNAKGLWLILYGMSIGDVLRVYVPLAGAR